MLTLSWSVSSCCSLASDEPEMLRLNCGVFRASMRMLPEPELDTALSLITSTLTTTGVLVRTDTPALNWMRSVRVSPLPSTMVCTSGSTLSSARTCTPSLLAWRTTTSIEPGSAIA